MVKDYSFVMAVTALPSVRGSLFCSAMAALLLLAACGGDSTSFPTNPGSRDAGASAGTGGARTGSGGSAGALGTGGGAEPPDSASRCDANRGTGIPVNSGTLSASVDGLTLSGPGKILWAAGTNSLTLATSADGTLVVVFPGCDARTFEVPGAGTTPDPVSITYTANGGDPQWACTYEDPQPGSATCTVRVTAYGDRQNLPVTGTFSGTLRLWHGMGVSTKTVSQGTFTFGRP